MDHEQITMRIQKLTEANAKQLAQFAKVVTNFPDIRYGPWAKLRQNTDETSLIWSSDWVRRLPPPLARVKAFESCPGLWLFDAQPSGHLFLLWSDGYKKCSWKGTSYEVIVNPDRIAALAQAFRGLIAYLEKYWLTSDA